jgi:hypothetical protein
MRFARNFLLLTLAVGAAACSSDDLGPSSAVIPPLAYVRYINALPDTFATTVRWIDEIEFTPQTFVGVAYRAQGQGGFQGIRAGTRPFRIFTYQQNVLNFPVAGNTTVLKDTTFNFEAGKYYTILYAGFTRTAAVPAAQLRIFEDEPAASPGAGNVAVRVYNVSYTGSWDVYLGPTATQVGDTSTTSTLYTAAPGTLVGSTTPAAAGGAVVTPYTNRAVGTYQTRFTLAGTLDRPGTAATATPVRGAVPAGLAETVDFEAAGGSNVAGSVMTFWVFGAQSTNIGGVAGSGTGAASRPAVLVTIDRSPARTIAP